MPFFLETPDRVLVHGKIFEKIIDANAVSTRIDALGEALNARFADLDPLFMPVLNGAFVFAADLVRRFQGHCQTDFVRLRSYAGERSTGEVQTILGIDYDLRGRHIIVVEDIVDSGRTLHHFLENLQAFQPASISVAAFLRKPDAMIFSVPVDFLGFDVPNRFVVGYGLDFDGLGRNLPAVYAMVEG